MRRLLVVGALVLGSCSPKPNDKPHEICGNGIDDDGNGFTDCQDPDCAGQTGCPMPQPDGGGNFGTCTRCGAACTRQSECLTGGFPDDTPLPECVGGRCQRLNTNVQVGFELDTADYAGVPNLGSMQTRMVSKLAVDGSAVSCATVAAAAMGNTATDADQIEQNGKFNVRGFDVTTLNKIGGVKYTNPFFNVGTGRNFLIWTELWYGPRGTNTRLPTGNRIGWGCFETGLEVAEIVEADTCTPGADAGATGCRKIRVKIPGQQTPD